MRTSMFMPEHMVHILRQSDSDIRWEGVQLAAAPDGPIYRVIRSTGQKETPPSILRAGLRHLEAASGRAGEGDWIG